MRFAWLDLADGREAPTIVTRPLAEVPHVAIGPDDRWLVTSGGAVAVVDPATGAEQVVAVPGRSVESATWGHDGSYVVAVSRAPRHALLVIGLDGTVTAETEAVGSDLGAPRVSPRGTRVAAVSYARDPEYLLFDAR